MNRKNIDGQRFVDLDEIAFMEIVSFKYEFHDAPTNMTTLKKGFRVDGVTKTGLRIESLYEERQSGTDKMCLNFINANWINAKK